MAPRQPAPSASPEAAAAARLADSGSASGRVPAPAAGSEAKIASALATNNAGSSAGTGRTAAPQASGE